MPYGGTTPAEDAKIERCVADVTPTLTQYSDPKEKKSHAIAICKSRIMKKEGLWYKRPIICEEKEFGGEKKTYIIGNAIEVGISRNKVKYTADELASAARTLIGKPLLLNHGDNDVRNIVGKIIDATFENNGVPFRAELDPNEHTIISKVKGGFINSVSIGADYKDIYEDNDGIKHPKGLEFLELSLVPVPGVPNATISQVIEERYELKKLEEENMEKEALMQEIADLKKKCEQLTTEKAEVAKIQEEKKPEPVVVTIDNSAVDALKEELAKLQKQVEQNKGITEEAPKEESKYKIIVEGKDTNGEIYNPRSMVFWAVDKNGKVPY